MSNFTTYSTSLDAPGRYEAKDGGSCEAVPSMLITAGIGIVKVCELFHANDRSWDTEYIENVRDISKTLFCATTIPRSVVTLVICPSS